MFFVCQNCYKQNNKFALNKFATKCFKCSDTIDIHDVYRKINYDLNQNKKSK